MVAIAKEFQLGSDFPVIDQAAWQKQVEVELKGAPFAKRMITRGYEGIELQPLYTEEMFPTAADPAGLPGYQPFVRGAQPLGNRLAGWDIRQEQAHPDPAVANTQILEDLNGGVTSIDLRLDGAAAQGLDADDPRAGELTGRDGVSVSSAGDLQTLARGVHLDIAGFHFDAGAAFLPAASLYIAFARQAGVPPGELRGGFNADPLKVLVRDGALPMPMDTALRQMADLAAWTAQNAPHMTAVEVSAAPYHNAGATSVADVAFAVATGRSFHSAMAVLAQQEAPRPEVMITSVGSEIYYRDPRGATYTRDTCWDAIISAGWDRTSIAAIVEREGGLTAQAPLEQRRFKLSYFADGDPTAATRIKALLERHGHSCSIIQSHGRYLDILPLGASKGTAVEHVRQRMGLTPRQVFVAGDSGNDIEMLRSSPHAIIVGNYSDDLAAHPDLAHGYVAVGHHARGIIEGVTHFRNRHGAARAGAR